MTQVSMRRYTNLASTLHILQTKCITLLDSSKWTDTNDAHFLEEYKQRKDAKTVLALCFAEAPETFHHWKVFSSGTDGVCIEFDKTKLVSTFADDPRVATGSMNYKLLRDMANRKSIRIDELPFLKRIPYHDEFEFRVIYLNLDKEEEQKDFQIKIDCITRITLSPWMHRSLATSVKNTIRLIEGCSKIKISHSTLLGNETWRSIAARAVE